MLTEKDITYLLRSNADLLPPLHIEIVAVGVPVSTPEGILHIDAALRLHWRERIYNFSAEIKSRQTPQALEQAVDAVLRRSRHSSTFPMVIAPYLSESALQQLEAQSISGVDLCGNGVVVVANELLVFRTGYPNKYPSSAPIKNVYRGNSSLVTRVFLARSEYFTVGEIQEETKKRGGKIALSTVSKVLSVMEEDILVGRQSGSIRLLQPEKLLDKLSANYQAPKINRKFQAKYLTDETAVMEALVRNAQANHARCVLTGTSSANLYAGMSRSDKLFLYCTNINALLSLQGGECSAPIEETARFADIELLETQDEAVYLDSRQDYKKLHNAFRSQEWLQIWLYGAASPVQTYLELMAGGPREKQTAEQVKQLILNEIGQLTP